MKKMQKIMRNTKGFPYGIAYAVVIASESEIQEAEKWLNDQKLDGYDNVWQQIWVAGIFKDENILGKEWREVQYCKP